MNMINKDIVLHPLVLEILFSHQDNVSSVFKDVLGLYEIDHIALAHIDNNQELLSFSSTPSLEFNLFSGNLWRFDKTYQASWYGLCGPSSWQSLYMPEHFDELYYLKQIKHQYPLGLSFAIKSTDGHIICSLASHKECQPTRDLFATQQEHFVKIAQYCSKLLLPLFNKNR